MSHARHSWLAVALLTGFSLSLVPAAEAQPKRAKPATQADIERLEKKIADQQQLIDKLVKLQQAYLQNLQAVLTEGAGTGTTTVVTPPTDPKTATPPADATQPVKPPPTRVEPKPAAIKAPAKKELGTIVGKVAGAADAIVYIDTIVAPQKGSATMKQEGKQFMPQVLVVPKGTTVQFPNRDAIFHNVFSVTPDNSFDLGSYRQGESKSVTMSRQGVVTVYCNMHPQMVGHILVTPNANYVRAGKDGFFRLPNVPAGNHRVVAWAPNAKPVTVQANVVADEVVTVELAVKKGRSGPHTKKDGLPYGSYEK